MVCSFSKLNHHAEDGKDKRSDKQGDGMILRNAFDHLGDSIKHGGHIGKLDKQFVIADNNSNGIESDGGSAYNRGSYNDENTAENQS